MTHTRQVCQHARPQQSIHLVDRSASVCLLLSPLNDERTDHLVSGMTPVVRLPPVAQWHAAARPSGQTLVPSSFPPPLFIALDHSQPLSIAALTFSVPSLVVRSGMEPGDAARHGAENVRLDAADAPLDAPDGTSPQHPESGDVWGLFGDDIALTDDEYASGAATQDVDACSPLHANEVAWLQRAAGIDWEEVRRSAHAQPCRGHGRPGLPSRQPQPLQELEKELQATPKSPKDALACDEAVLARLFDHRVMLLEPPCMAVKHFFSDSGGRGGRDAAPFLDFLPPQRQNLTSFYAPAAVTRRAAGAAQLHCAPEQAGGLSRLGAVPGADEEHARFQRPDAIAADTQRGGARIAEVRHLVPSAVLAALLFHPAPLTVDRTLFKGRITPSICSASSPETPCGSRSWPMLPVLYIAAVQRCSRESVLLTRLRLSSFINAQRAP